MKNEITPDQQKQIADILDQAEANGLLGQAMSSELSADEQERFLQIMQDRIDQLYTEITVGQGYADLGVNDLKKKLSKGFCQKFCDGTQLKENYRSILELGGDKERELMKDVMCVFIMLVPLSPPNAACFIALYMTLYIMRIQLDKRCAKLCQSDN
jgi:hypothetical protein